jgi:hypothetical protein
VECKAGFSAAFLIASIMSTGALAAERFDLLFTDASYSSADQHELNYTSFVGDKETGAIYSCAGNVVLNQDKGNLTTHTESCVDAHVSPSGSRGEYSFSRISSLDATAKPNAPKMNPTWGFWRVDQVNHRLGFCTRYIDPKVIWTCFEAPLPAPP